VPCDVRRLPTDVHRNAAVAVQLHEQTAGPEDGSRVFNGEGYAESPVRG
jgi:hypothetical protein